jgi:hypothetical protein
VAFRECRTAHRDLVVCIRLDSFATRLRAIVSTRHSGE